MLFNETVTAFDPVFYIAIVNKLKGIRWVYFGLFALML